MNPNISITLNTPHVTIERYSELTGLPVDTINDMLADATDFRGIVSVKIRSVKKS